MKLSRASTVIICTATLGLIILAYLPITFIILRGFAGLEERILLRNTERAENALKGQVREIDSLVWDWSSWDDMRAFARDGYEGFVDSNLVPQTFAYMCLDVAAVISPGGVVLHQSTYDREHARILDQLPPELEAEQDWLVETLMACGGGDCSVTGLLPLADGVLMLSARPIFSSNGAGPPAGVFMFGRFLSDDITAQLERETRLDLGLAPLAAEDHTWPEPEGSGEPVVERDGMRSITSHALLADIHGRPVLALAVTMDRETYMRGLAVSMYALAALMAAGLIFGLATHWWVKRRVLSRVQRLSSQVALIGESGDVGRRVTVRGSDEIAALQTLTNDMLAELERSRARLDEQYQEIQDSERYLRQLLDALNVGLLLVAPDTFEVVSGNERVLELTGHGRADIQGVDFRDLFHMDGPEPLNQDRDMELFEGRLLRADGTSLPVLCSRATVERQGLKYLLTTFIDISKRHAAEKALRVSEETYRAIFTNSGAATLIAGGDGVVNLANQEFANLSGVDPHEVQGVKDWREFLHPEDADLFADWPERVRRLGGSPEPCLCRFVTGAGEERFVTLSVAPIPGADAGVVSILDITERRRAEEALRAAHDDLERKVAERTRMLEEANEALRKMDRVRSSFLSSASHELRTPLTSVVGFAKLMHRNFRRLFLPLARDDFKLARRAQEFSNNLEIIAKEGERLTRLINDLLDLNKIESGRLEWRDMDLETNRVLDMAAASVAGLVEAKPELELALDVPEGLPRIHADPDRMQQVLINLLDNAVKFTDSGRVTLGASTDEHGMLKVWVADTGPGIDPEEVARIFDKFFQSQRRDPERAKIVGTGLGLAICRQIVEHYGGVIWAESEPGRGAVFTFTLPPWGA